MVVGALEGTGLPPHAESWLWTKLIQLLPWDVEQMGVCVCLYPPQLGHPAAVGDAVPVLMRVLLSPCLSPVLRGSPLSSGGTHMQAPHKDGAPQ